MKRMSGGLKVNAADLSISNSLCFILLPFT